MSHKEKMVLNESFQVVAIIEKLLYFLKDFKYYLKHKYEDMSLEYLILKLSIIINHLVSKKSRKLSIKSNTNLVE